MQRYLLTCRADEPELLRLSAAAPPDDPALLSGRLAGGFPSWETGFPLPLSATLQLNADLGIFSEQQLLALALAEEQRRQTADRVRRYRLEVPPQAAVIAAKLESLVSFLGLYGGLLELVPVLWSQTAAAAAAGEEDGAEIVRAEELEVGAASYGGFELNCRRRQPIDKMRCTLCRRCRAVCEPGCIDSRLNLDLSRCSGCGRCLEVCPAGAIDLQTWDERRCQAPALILLDGVEPALPAAAGEVYREAEMERFLRRIGTHEIEELVVFHRESCQYSPRLGRGCRRCYEVCENGALRLGKEGVAIDHLACGACGACVAACPTGALEDGRFPDRTLASFFADLAIQPGSTLVLGREAPLREFWWHHPEERWAATFFLAYPNPAALSLYHFLLFYALGFGRVVLLAEEPEVVPRAAAEAGEILGALTSLGEFAVPASPGELAGILARKPAAAPPLPPPGRFDLSFTGRRPVLARILTALIGAASRPLDPLPRIASPVFGRVVCDAQRCTLCAACLNECRSGALSGAGHSYNLSFEALLCVQCGLCRDCCPENALELVNGLELVPDFTGVTVLAADEPVRCRACGAPFGSRKSHQRVLALLQATGRFTEQQRFLDYCEKCRAVKVFESHAESE